MDRIYRVKQGMGGRYAVERDGKLYWMRGECSATTSPATRFPPASRQFLAPVQPSIVVCIGLNYKDHAAEMKKKLPDGAAGVPQAARAAVIGPDERDSVAGVGRPHRARSGDGGRDRQARVAASRPPRPWTTSSASPASTTSPRANCRRKTCSIRAPRASTRSAPIGPCIAVGLDPSALDVEGWVNAERRQKSNTRELIFPVPYLVEHVSRFMTLNPGDVITTGTPSGVGPLRPGDRMMVKVEGVGTLGNPCVVGRRPDDGSNRATSIRTRAARRARRRRRAAEEAARRRASSPPASG